MHFHAQFKSPSHIIFCHHLHKHKLHNWNVMSQANKSYSGTISAINDCINNSHTHTVIARSIFDNYVWHNYGEFHHKSGDLFDMCQNWLNFLLFVRIARTHTFSFSINSIHLKLIFVTPTHTKKIDYWFSQSVSQAISYQNTPIFWSTTHYHAQIEMNSFELADQHPPTPYS